MRNAAHEVRIAELEEQMADWEDRFLMALRNLITGVSA
jgi:hypothetical protein